MKHNNFWAAVSKTLAAVTITIIVTLLLAPAAGAASKYKVLYNFHGERRIRTPGRPHLRRGRESLRHDRSGRRL